jgi:hypothetical protein
MANEPIKQVNKLMVGQSDFSHLPSVPVLPGTSVLNGPVWIGAGVPVPTANCMIGPGLNPITLQVTGISNFLGPVTNITGVINRFALTNATGVTVKTGISIKQALSAVFGLKTNAAVQITAGPKICQAIATVPLIKADLGVFGVCTAAQGNFASVAAPFKKFDITHPTKSGYRLVHTCLEGPEIGVYYRGKLVNSNIIELPEYWRGLVDAETITVSLTPHRCYQELFYELSDWGTKIKVINNSGGPVDCSYIVYAERKDVPKLEIEPKQEENKKYPEHS